jgi:hypothetical protein
LRADSLDRRRFLVGLAQLAVTACAGSQLAEESSAAGSPSETRRRKTVELRKPYAVPYEVREIRDTTFVVRPDFRMPYTQGLPFGLTPRGVIWVPPNHPGLLIRGCQIVGWSDRWVNRWSSDDPDWIGKDGSSRPLQECNGITADYVAGLTIEDVQIERMPGSGVYLAAVRDASIHRVHTRRCFSAVQIDYFSPVSEQRRAQLPRRLSSDVVLDGCIAMDNWGIGYAGREEYYRGIYDPAECIGSAGFYLYSTERLTVRRCLSIGSNKGGMKLAHCRDALIEDFYGRSIQLVGCLYWSKERGPHQLPTMADGSPSDPMLSERIRVVNPTLSRGASLTPPSWDYWPIACAYPHRSPIQIEGGHVWAQNPPTMGYLQAWEGVAVDVRGVTFHGPKPASLEAPEFSGLFSIGGYGGPKSRPSSINRDLLTANEWRATD